MIGTRGRWAHRRTESRGAGALATFCLLAAVSVAASPLPWPAAPTGTDAPSMGARTCVPFSLAGWTPEPAAPAAPSGPPPFRLSGEAEDKRQNSLSAPKGKALQAWLESAGFAAVVTVNYWTSNSFPEDRDFRITLDDQIRRIFLLRGWRFDSNQFSLNWSHFLSGAIYYQFGRGSRMSWLYSWAMAMAGSTWWEVVGEPKEVIAINDQIMTGLGGFAAGEPWYQIGHYLIHRKGLLPRALSLLNPAVRLNHWLDGKNAAAADFEPPGWHEINLFAGARWISSGGGTPGAGTYLGFEARLLGIPEYGRSGEFRRAAKDPYWSEITLDYALRGGHAEETRFFTKAVALGRFVQRIGGDGAGYSLTLGFGSAFELFKKRPIADYDADPVPVKTDFGRLCLDEPRNFTDKLAVLHVAGPVLDWTVFRRDLRLSTVLEAYGDFALVNACALNDYSAAHDIVGLKTTVFYYGYYYGFGGTASASARLDWKGFRARGLAAFSAWGSADVLDRFQDEVTNNSHLSDVRARFLLGAGWRMPGTPLELFAEVESVRRGGRLAEVRASRLEKKACAGLAFSF